MCHLVVSNLLVWPHRLILLEKANLVRLEDEVRKRFTIEGFAIVTVLCGSEQNKWEAVIQYSGFQLPSLHWFYCLEVFQ